MAIGLIVLFLEASAPIDRRYIHRKSVYLNLLRNTVNTFAHILNPVAAPEGSELAIAQPIAWASILRAQADAREVAHVDVFTASFADESIFLPENFTKLPALDRSIKDVASVKSPRRLPLLRDVLDRAYAATDAEYLVYTNADIALMPNFYKVCAYYVQQGLDAFVINRRRIPARFNHPDQLDRMYAEAGEMHTGYDTLVFKRSLYPKFTLGDVCIGIPFFDTVLIHNLYAHAPQFRLFTKKHLTFHVGLDLVKRWGDSDQYAHNNNEYKKVLKTLYPLFQIEKFPAASLGFFRRHYKWLMNPTFHYPTMLRLDLSQLNRPRRAYPALEPVSPRYSFFNRFIASVNFPDEE